MILKPGVRILGLRPEMVVVLIAADKIWQRHGAELVVTSAIDGTHSRASKHYTGCAVDLRVHNLADAEKAASELRSALGADFDVIYESAGTSNAHIHCEFDPKIGY